MDERIPEAELERARDHLCQSIGWAILTALCESDATVADLAKRSGKSLRYVRLKLNNPRKLTLGDAGVFLLALGRELDIKVRSREKAVAWTWERPQRPHLPGWLSAYANDNRARAGAASAYALDMAMWGLRRAA